MARDRDDDSGHTAEHKDSVPAPITHAALAAAAAQGIDVAELLAGARLAEADLGYGDPDARVPFDRHMAIWEQLATMPAAENIGLRMGSMMHPEVLGVVGYAALRARTVAEAHACVTRYRRLVHDIIVPEFALVDGKTVMWQVLPGPIAELRHPAEGTLSSALSFFRAGTGRSWVPLAVHFQHAAPRDTRLHRELFGGCPMFFSAAQTRMELEAALYDHPHLDPDPVLRQRYERHAQSLLERLPDDQALAGRVRRVLVNQLVEGGPRQDEVARELGVSTRTLHRRLRDEGLTLYQIVDQLRLELARLYLADPGLSSTDVAFLLGFNETSAFFRAFRRWTGTTPRSFRAQQAAAPG